MATFLDQVRSGRQVGALGQNEADLAQFRGAGFFDPRGSVLLRAQLRREAVRNARNRRLRGQLSSRLSGLSGADAQGFDLGLEQDIGRDTSDLLGGFQTQQLLGTQDFARGQLSDALSFERQRKLAEEQAKREEKARGGIGAGIGTIVGTGLGAFTGGYGTALGGALAGRRK